MGSNNAARMAQPGDQLSSPDLLKTKENIQQKKELLEQDVVSLFNSIKDRAHGKETELTNLAGDLFVLLQSLRKISPEADNFQDRIDAFRSSFDDLKNKLNVLSQDNEDIGFKIDRKNYKHESGAILNGVEDDDNGTFKGEIKFADGRVLFGYAKKIDDKFVPDGDSHLELKSGDKTIHEEVGVWKDGVLQSGNIYDYDSPTFATISRIKDGVVETEEHGFVNERGLLDGDGYREIKNTGKREMGIFKKGKLVEGKIYDRNGKVLEEISIQEINKTSGDLESGKNIPHRYTQYKTPDGSVLDGEFIFKPGETDGIFDGIISDSKIDSIFKGTARELSNQNFSFLNGEQTIKLLDGSEKIIEYKNGKQVKDNTLSFKDKNDKLDKEIIALLDQGGDVVDFTDGYNQTLKNGKIFTTADGSIVYNGEVNFRGNIYNGETKLDKARMVFVKNGKGKFVNNFSTRGSGSETEIQDGEFENGKFVKGDVEIIGKDLNGIQGATKMKGKYENGQTISATYEVKNNKDSKNVNFDGQVIQDPDRVVLRFEGEFTMPNGTIYKGAAFKKSGTEFQWYAGEKEMIKAGGAFDKVVDMFSWKKKKKGEPVEVPVVDNQAKLEETKPSVPETVPEDGEIRDKNGKLIDKIVNGEIAPKEKGKIGKTADVVFTKETAKITNQVAYKTMASIYGVKTITDIGLALTAGVLNKVGESTMTPEWVKKGAKSNAEAAGSYSDIYKYYVGREQIAEIKKSFAEYMDAQQLLGFGETGGELQTDGEILVEAKYSSLKSKIESADQINPEAKAKLLLKLEKLKLKFETEREVISEQEWLEAYKTVEAFAINNTAGMQLARDAFSGVCKATLMVATAGTSGAAETLALATKVAIGRVLGMATTKVIERVQKHSVSREQKKIEGVENEVGYAKDLMVHSLLETMHGMSAGIFNGGKDVKSGKQLDGKARLANFAKSWGNAFVAGSVLLATQGTTIGEVFGSFFHKAEEVNGAGGSVARETMRRVHEQVTAGGLPPEGAKVAVAGIAGGEVRNAADSATSGVGGDRGAATVESRSATVDAAPEAPTNLDSTKFLEAHDKLSDQAKTFFTDLVAKHPGLNKEGTLKVIWDASENKRSSLDITGAKVQTEIFKAIFASEGKAGALAYLKDDAHLHGLALQKLGKGGFEAFVDKFDAAKDNPAALDKLSHQLNGAMKADIDTDLTNKGYIERHADGSVRDVGAGKARHFFGVDKNGKAILDSGKVTRFTHGTANLEQPVSSEKIVIDTEKGSERVLVGKNIKAAVPEGWKVRADGQGLTTSMVDAQSGHTLIPVYESGNGLHNDLVSPEKTHWVDVSTGKIYDSSGKHLEDLNFAKKSGNIAWGQGGSVGEVQHAESEQHSVASKGATVEQSHKGEEVAKETGGAKKIVEKTIDGEKAVPVKVADEAPVEEAKAAEEIPPAVKEITTLESGREAIASMENLDAVEKTRLSNFTYLLQWQQNLYGQDGSSLRNALEGEDAFGTIDKNVIDKMMSDLAHNNESARKALMSAIQNNQPYGKIIESMNDKMPGYSMLYNNENAAFNHNVFETDLSKNALENQQDFKNLEVNRVKEMIDKAQQEKFLQMRTARK